MASVPPSSENHWPSETAPIADPYTPVKARAPFSKAAVAGFIISCIGLIVFAVAGPLGTALSGIGFRRAREHGLRGRGLAIAGMILGAADFAFYLLGRYAVHS